MSGHPADVAFQAGIPATYERHLVPVIFTPYATELARRLEGMRVSRVLELAAGTGAVTREMAARLPASVAITATDLNQSMLDQAARVGTARAVEWRQADAQALPFADRSFDAVVCQFGVMFLPDKVRGFAEARRVLTPDGTFLFATWDRVETNEFCDVIMRALDARFGREAVDFMRRTPHGYFDPAVIREDLARAGFPEVTIDGVEKVSVAESAESAAIGYCQGNPMRLEIERLGPGAIEEATRVAAAALRDRYGAGEIEGRISALVVEARCAR